MWNQSWVPEVESSPKKNKRSLFGHPHFKFAPSAEINPPPGLDKADDLCRKKKHKQAPPYIYAAIAKNPENLDAAVQFALLNDRKDALEILEASELKGDVSDVWLNHYQM